MNVADHCRDIGLRPNFVNEARHAGYLAWLAPTIRGSRLVVHGDMASALRIFLALFVAGVRLNLCDQVAIARLRGEDRFTLSSGLELHWGEEVRE